MSGANPQPQSVRWRVGPARFLLFLPIGLLLSGFCIFLLMDEQPLALVPLGVFLLLTAWAVAGLIWPPELDISVAGLRYTKWGKPRSFCWNEIEGPTRGPTFGSGTTLKLVIKATGQNLSLAPSLFDCTYEEVADIINDARAGRLTTSAMWRRGHRARGSLNRFE